MLEGRLVPFLGANADATFAFNLRLLLSPLQ